MVGWTSRWLAGQEACRRVLSTCTLRTQSAQCGELNMERCYHEALGKTRPSICYGHHRSEVLLQTRR